LDICPLTGLPIEDGRKHAMRHRVWNGNIVPRSPPLSLHVLPPADEHAEDSTANDQCSEKVAPRRDAGRSSFPAIFKSLQWPPLISEIDLQQKGHQHQIISQPSGTGDVRC
jgi:hypothetical protein